MDCSIIGMSIRVEGCTSNLVFWETLMNEGSFMKPMSKERWDLLQEGTDKKWGNREDITGMYLEGIDCFDSGLFKLSGGVSKFTDPRQRLLLEACWGAVEDAGLKMSHLKGKRVGVFIAHDSFDFASYYRKVEDEDLSYQDFIIPGNVSSFLANRISYLLDLKGPSMAINSTCSSIYVALHHAKISLEKGECDYAIVGGISLFLEPWKKEEITPTAFESIDSEVKSFSNEAAGYRSSEGCGALLLQRSRVEEEHSSYAVIKSTGYNSGGKTDSFAQPSQKQQELLFREVLDSAKITASDIEYIEAHGISSLVGDAIEAKAIIDVFKRDTHPCYVSTIKPNLGHAHAASGLYSLMKVILAMKYKYIPPIKGLKGKSLNESIPKDTEGISFVTDAISWDTSKQKNVLLTSYGFSNVNAAVLLCEPVNPVVENSQYHIGDKAVICLSANTKDQVYQQIGRLRDFLKEQEVLEERESMHQLDCHQVAYTLQTGREAMQFRWVALVASGEELITILSKAIAEKNTTEEYTDTMTFWGDSKQNKEQLAELKKEPKELDKKLVEAFQSSDYKQLATYWVTGINIKWEYCYKEKNLQSLHLPIYPFAKKSYWIPKKIETEEIERTLHPLLHANTSDLTQQKFTTLFTGEEDFLVDHVVGGTKIFPGAAYLELIRAAADRSLPNRITQIKDVIWLTPKWAKGVPKEMYTSLSPWEDEIRYEVYSLDNTVKTLHSQGSVTTQKITPKVKKYDIAALKERMPNEITGEQWYRKMANLDLVLGKCYTGVDMFYHNDDEVMTRINFSKEEGYVLSVGIMDSALQTCVGWLLEKENYIALPFGVKEVNIYKEIPGGTLWGYAKKSENNKENSQIINYDIDLLDTEGEVVIGFKEFVIRSFNGEETNQQKKKIDTKVISKDVKNKSLELKYVQYIKEILSKELKVLENELELHAPFESYGIDSVLINRLTNRLEESFGRLSRTLFFEYQTLGELIDYFIQEHSERLNELIIKEELIISSNDAIKADHKIIPDVKGERFTTLENVRESDDNKTTSTDIAIIGLSGRYPEAKNINEFWENLKQGKDCITEIPDDRWEKNEFYHQEKGVSGKSYSKWGGFMKDIDKFDPLFFNIAPNEAQLMDPQERLFLQIVWETIEDAGYTRAQLLEDYNSDKKNRNKIGVYAGAMFQDYSLLGVEQAKNGGFVPDGIAANIANRVSYFFNFQGPSITLDTMCSSSLTAIHMACQGLLTGDAQMAIAGGVNISSHPNKYFMLCQKQFLSSRGKCESFGIQGNGYVPGEGVGAVLLKPLDKAKADGDHIYGIIKGTSINHGGKTNGYTVPNPIAQSSAIKETIKKAGVKAEDFSYIEAHGTGTSLGDPIEMTGLTRAFQSDKKQFCSIGSVKSNIGHCESAAGISGITKVLLQLKYKQLVPSLHSSELNPYIDFEVTPFKVQQELEEWTTINNKPRLAGVSSFGAGGSNAHIIIEEYDNTDQISNSEIKTLLSSVVIVLSAKNKARLQECVQNLKDYVDKTKGLNLYDIAYTLQTGREAMNERLAFVTKDISTLIAELENYLEGKTKNITTGIVKKDKANSKLGSQNKDEESLVAIRNKDNELLTQIWVKGEIIDWEALYSGHSPKRISLPTYPFEQKRYWLPEIPKLVEISNPYKNGHSTLELRNIETNQSVNGVHKEVEEKVCFTPHWKPKELTKTSSKSKTSGDSVTIFVASSRTDIIEKIEALDIADHVFELHPAQDIANQVLNNTLQLFEYCKYLIKNKKSRQEKLIVYVPYKDTAFPYRSLMGLLRSVALESPFLKTQLVFDSALEKGAINEITKHLNDEIHFSNNASEVLYTQDQSRFLFTQKKLSNTADVPHTSKIKINGVYLITGGLGSLGHVFTEFIGEYKGVKIVLTGRSSITPEKKIALEKLSLKGIEVHYVSCDLSREATTKQMIDDVINRFGTIDGVIHSAGVIRDNYCVKKTASEILDVLSPKVTSVIHLDEVTKDIALDFFVLFSSIASLGSAGQIDYATGNAFMDIFAQHRADLVKKGIRKGKSISLNWPLWKDGGMTPGVFYEEAMFKNWGMRPLKTKTGIQAFINALESEEHQYGIITGNAQKILKTLKINAIEENDEVYKAVKRPLITLESIQNNVLEEISKIIGIDKIDIDPSEELIDYGLESVTLMQLVELLNTIYNLDYSGASFFELTTVRLITAQIYESINKERPQLEIFQEVISPDSAKKKAHHDTIFESENELENKIQDSVLEGISKVIGIEKSAINLTDALIDYGLDSLTLMQLADILNTIYDSNYTGSTFFELDTVALITSHLYENIKHNQPQVKIFENKQPILVVDQKEIVIIDKLQIKNQDAERREIKGQHKLAIIGYDCKFPNSDNPDAFWKNIIDKVVTIKNIKPEQWKKRGIAGGSIHKSMKWGSLLHDVDRFDAPFWGVSRLKAEEMDPQLRLLLQSVWRGIEHSGYAISTFSEQKIGVFVAADATDYEVVLKENNKIPSIENSISVGMLSNRISYYFNFNGPSESIDNACSSVYVALSQAQRALQTGACDVAIVAGVKLLLDPLGFMMREELLSTSGNMYSFDKKSDGYIRGEGVGCLILKPATEAQKDLNTIHAIVAGTSIVHNGNKGFSSMAPNVEAQYEAMKAAYYMAGIDPETVHYIEAHGTATNFNDAAEIAAYKKFLKAEMSENAYKNHRCAISTVKPNIGHLEGASGIASILKAVLALKHHKIPPVALFSEPHPSLFLEDSPFYIPTELSDWEIKKGEIIDEEYPRRVALHAVGIGGVNAHVILEEHHAKPKKAAENINKKYRPKLFVISTKSQMALKKYGEKWLRYLNDIENSDENTAQLLANIAYSSQFTREAMPYRQAFVAGSLEEMKTCLQKGILGIEKWKSNTSYLVTNGDHPVGKVSDMATELTKDRSFKYLRMLAEQWISGISIDWKTFSKNEYVERTSIPEYPFEEEKYWYGVSENEENIEDPFETLFHETFINE